jgi:hypothetical protein
VWEDGCSSTVQSSGRDALSSLQAAEGETLVQVQAPALVLGLGCGLAALFELAAGSGSVWVLVPRLLQAAKVLLAGVDRLQMLDDLGSDLSTAHPAGRAAVPFRWDSFGLDLLADE